MWSNRPRRLANRTFAHCMRAPEIGRAHGVRERVFSERCGRGQTTRPYHCAALAKRYAMMQSSRPSAASAAR
eukprot:10207818-Lingulodinium_polyedra.AAC.1